MNGHFSPSFYREHIEPRTLTRATDPGTSQEAALHAVEHAADHCGRVLVALRRLGGTAGAEQIARACGLEPYQTRKRLADVERLGLAHPTGDTRITASGRRERLWSLA